MRGRRWGMRSSRASGKQYLDVGCGARTHDDFVNLDYTWQPGIDLCCDATKGIPLATGSMKGIYSEHCIEHLTLAGANAVFAEFKRLLAPGGTLRIIVPDGELYARLYVGHRNGSTTDPFPHQEIDGINGIRTPMMSLNRIFTMWGHQVIYDFETMTRMLEHQGFVEITRQSFRTGTDPMLLNDDESHVAESLYVEARQPA